MTKKTVWMSELADKLAGHAEENGHVKTQGKAPAPDTPAEEPKKTTKAGLGSLLQQQAKDAGHEKVQGGTPDETNKTTRAGLAAVLGQAKGGDNPMDTHHEPGIIPTWSFSTMKEHERCPQFTKLAKVDKVPQAKGDALVRGSYIHDELEKWVRGETEELPVDKKTKFDGLMEDFKELRELYNDPDWTVTLEENWGVRQDWSPCTWSFEDPETNDPELWGKASLDAFIISPDGKSCRVIDYKSGRKYGNEMKHSDQGYTYALHVFHRFPDIENFTIEFWYVDQGVKMDSRTNRNRLKVMLPKYHRRALRVTTEEHFYAKPSPHACQYCAYGNNRSKKGKAYGNGACDFDYFKGAEDDAV